MTDKRQQIGQWGENQAVRYLEAQGYVILKRNHYTPYGELDIICRIPPEKGGQLVFVEVKTRTNRRFGYPEESITSRKRDNIVRSIADYLQNHPELPDRWRIDVIAVRKLKGKPAPEIQHFENVFV